MGAKPRIIYDNLWRKGTALVASPIADPQHPSSDTQLDTLSMFFKASAATTPCTIPVDQGAAPGAIDFIAIIAHNIDSDATITLEGDDADAFNSDGGNPQVVRTLTYNATNIFEFVTAFTKQYVRIQLVSGNGNFSAAPQIATILCGNYVELNRRFAPEYEVGEEDFSVTEYGESQVLFAQEKETLNIRQYTYQALNTASITEIQAMFKECKTIKAFAFCHDSSDPNSNTLWVRNSELNSPVCRNSVWYWTMTIKEVK